MDLLKREEKIVFYFLSKIKTVNEFIPIALNVLVIKKKNKKKQNKNKTATNNKQTKKNRGKNKQIKNGNNSTHHEPLSEEWIGRRS